MLRCLCGLLVSLLWVSFVQAEEKPPVELSPSDAIHRYVSRPEPDFAWKLAQTIPTARGTVHRLELTSQKWQQIVWKHALLVYEPKVLEYPEHMLLFVTGGRTGGVPSEKDLGLGLALAERCGARVATLHAVPNQPLFGDRVEDDLITETWLKYLETGDDSWPLLFPMVKSAVKAMDCLERFCQEQYKVKPTGFVITWASKRGWTSWLTPVADKRIIATAPIVINVLNFPEQMKYQLDTWGKYSEQIEDYTSKGLIKPNGPETERERLLWCMMDPYVYRKDLTLPKLMVVGTNDPYWVVDAMNLYWDGLEGPKYTLQIPNAGHGLDDGRDHALTTIAVFFRHQAGKIPMPKLDWKYNKATDSVSLSMSAEPAPVGVRFWTADSEDKDFRDEEWIAKPLEVQNGACQGDCPKRNQKHVAVFGEFQYKLGPLNYSFTTQAYRD